ncbi:MAG TPA: hypothetical protein VLU43_04770 [Anaeromyxobacteraceae bacterium]|nr:hypothetical protein [Anaeromyxobacteraceae bacterium]
MVATLATLALLSAVGAPQPDVVQHEEPVGGEPELVRLDSPTDVAVLCATLQPTERLRPQGDPVQRGEQWERHEDARDAAYERRYRIVIPAAGLVFSPYDAREERLVLSSKSDLLGAGGAARIWATEERGLPVEVAPAAARRVVDARAAARLRLAIVFDLPDDATCGGGRSKPPRWTLPAEPVSWTYLDGDAVVARGGAGSDRPLLTVAEGATARVEIGEPLSGPAEVRSQVEARAADLQACYASALALSPGLDGLLVADLGGKSPALVGDSVGDEGLAQCVRKALEKVAGGARAEVPIRFVLSAPGESAPVLTEPATAAPLPAVHAPQR